MASSATAPAMALTMTSPTARASCRLVISKSGSVAEASRAPKMTSWPDFFQPAPRACATFPVPRMAIFMGVSLREQDPVWMVRERLTWRTARWKVVRPPGPERAAAGQSIGQHRAPVPAARVLPPGGGRVEPGLHGGCLLPVPDAGPQRQPAGTLLVPGRFLPHRLARRRRHHPGQLADHPAIMPARGQHPQPGCGRPTPASPAAETPKPRPVIDTSGNLRPISADLNGCGIVVERGGERPDRDVMYHSMSGWQAVAWVNADPGPRSRSSIVVAMRGLSSAMGKGAAGAWWSAGVAARPPGGCWRRRCAVGQLVGGLVQLHARGAVPRVRVHADTHVLEPLSYTPAVPRSLAGSGDD